jgi:hypothetical protein
MGRSRNRQPRKPEPVCFELRVLEATTCYSLRINTWRDMFADPAMEHMAFDIDTEVTYPPMTSQNV